MIAASRAGVMKCFTASAKPSDCSIAARSLQGEQQFEIVFRLHEQERLALAAGRVAERVLVLKVFAQVRLVFEKAFDFVAAQIVGRDRSVEVVHQLRLVGSRQVGELKRILGDAGELLAPELGIGSRVCNKLLQSRPPQLVRFLPAICWPPISAAMREHRIRSIPRISIEILLHVAGWRSSLSKSICRANSWTEHITCHTANGNGICRLCLRGNCWAPNEGSRHLCDRPACVVRPNRRPQSPKLSAVDRIERRSVA